MHSASKQISIDENLYVFALKWRCLGDIIDDVRVSAFGPREWIVFTNRYFRPKKRLQRENRVQSGSEKIGGKRVRQAAAAVATGNQWQLNKCLYLNIKQCIKRFICRCHYKWITPTSANHDDVECVPLQLPRDYEYSVQFNEMPKQTATTEDWNLWLNFCFVCVGAVITFRIFVPLFSLVLRPNAQCFMP